MAVLLNMDALSKHLLELGLDKIPEFPKVCEHIEAGMPLPVLIKEILQVEKTETETLIVFNIGEKLKWLIGKEAKKDEWEKQGASEKVWVVPENSSVLNTSVRRLLQYIEPKLKRIVKTPVPDNAQLPFTSIELPEAAPIVDPVEEEPRVAVRQPSGKMKKPKKPKVPKVKVDKSLRAVFKVRLSELDIEKLKKKWMFEKAFALIDTEAALEDWVDKALCQGAYTKRSRDHWRFNVIGELVPVVAVDTETVGLDDRILVWKDEGGNFIYEVKAEIAGVCLSCDGAEGIYIPVNHEKGLCISREAVCRILQRLFNQAHLVFYNAKFDREILRVCVGIGFRPYPHFEDVQVLQYDNDPKADLDDQKKGKKGDAGGLKMLSETLLDMPQIELGDIAKVKASMIDPVTCKCKHSKVQHEGKCTGPKCTCEAFVARETLRVQYAPFNWIPTDIALWYAASDAICTWLLWEKCIYPARNRKTIHKIDHQLVDTITWIERQRFLIDTERHAKTVNWHQLKLHEIEKKLQAIAEEYGWPVQRDDAGVALEHTQLNVTSQPQISRLLFDIKKMKIVKKSQKTGKPSVDADALKDLNKLYPDDKFLKQLDEQKKYIALHPENLRWEPKDKTVRVFFRTNVVAGGRLSASGGEFDVDGGFGLNPQGIKKGSDNWLVSGNILVPDKVEPEDIEEHAPEDLHEDCFRKKEGKAPGIIKNHIGNYMGYAICLVPSCTTCREKFGILIEDGKLDAAEVLNLRALFVAPPGWTMFSIDYSNIEMRAAANCSGEPKFINEFLNGKGDFHVLTAIGVFPEYSDPNTPQEVKDDLRAIAKIMNFAMLYGGTAHALQENLKKRKPYSEMKPEELKAACEGMLKKYWDSVPVFRDFCELKMREAREGPVPTNEPHWDGNTRYFHGDIVQYESNGTPHVYICLHKDYAGIVGGGEPDDSANWIKYMRCTTNVGRVVNFVSGMEAMGIHPPTKEEFKNYKQYNFYRQQAEFLKDSGDEKATLVQAAAQALLKGEKTGVKNHMDYQRFFSKIQRVAVNVPLQGLAGDFMRWSLNRICEFATVREPLVQTIMRLHATVHDEIDFIVKNEYVPFIIPRITRLMKLRTLHERKKWPVPIECSVEYGHSWEGGDKTTSAGYTKIAGLENYIPDDMKESVEPLLAVLDSGDETRRAKVDRWLRKELHPKLSVEDPSDKKWKYVVQKIMDAKDHDSRRNNIVIALQMNEMWKLDEVPDGAAAAMETFGQYEARMGLGPQTRDPLYPEFGFLDAIPLKYNIIRPTLQRLDDGSIPSESTTTVEMPSVALEAPRDQQSLFQEAAPPLEPVMLKTLTREDKDRLFVALGKEFGKHEVPVMYVVNGERIIDTIKRCRHTAIPDEFKDDQVCST
jgi:DNA polymerase I-like protein with 3'-5' exonuclease and polymerase domains